MANHSGNKKNSFVWRQMSYKRGDFVQTSYNEIGVILKAHTDQGSKPVYFIRVASGESNWFTLENLAPLGDVCCFLW